MPSSLQALRSLRPCSASMNATSALKAGKLQPFFWITDFSASLSRLRSATSCFSRRFSSSSLFSRCASATYMPPNFDFHLVKRRRAAPVLTAQLHRPHPSRMLLQDPHDLLSAEPALLHPASSRSHCKRTPGLSGLDPREQVTTIEHYNYWQCNC